MPGSELVQSLLRGMDILKLISSKPEGMRLSELVDETGLQKSTLHNLLRTLAAREFIVKDSLNRFAVGPAIVEMANAVSKNDIREKIKKHLLHLAELFPGHVVTLATLKGSKIQRIMRVSPDLPGMVQTPSEQMLMPYISVTAIALQAGNPVPAAELEKRFPFEDYGVGKWGTRERFDLLKKQVLKDGFCCQFSEERTAAAFIMPDTLALGFSIGKKMVNMLAEYNSAAQEMRRIVWNQ
ncbi:MAG: helix-turn-helix domain-containing protein [Lentisphaeria bacterium]|nr:helix-turn-helix domain-containing protein [Lentisphaeria bacterium]